MNEKPTSLILDSVEYLPNGRFLEYRRKLNQRYYGIHARSSDGMMCLSIQSKSAYKRHNIALGSVYAITVNGSRHVLETPHGRWRLRAQEITRIVEGRCEDWANEYFDSTSPRYFKNDADYEPEIDPDLRSALQSRPNHAKNDGKRS